MRQLYIPDIGDVVTLASPWKFKLFAESRNASALALFGFVQESIHVMYDTKDEVFVYSQAVEIKQKTYGRGSFSTYDFDFVNVTDDETRYKRFDYGDAPVPLKMSDDDIKAKDEAWDRAWSETTFSDTARVAAINEWSLTNFIHTVACIRYLFPGKSDKEVYEATKDDEWRTKQSPKSVEAEIPEGCQLKVDRIYIRKGKDMSDYSSVTFFWMNAGKVEVRSGRWKAKARKVKSPRFWAKLADVNTMNIK